MTESKPPLCHCEERSNLKERDLKKMKKLFTYLTIGLLVWSCTETNPKPKNLIPEDKMVDILYDLNMFQAIRSNNYQLFNSYDLKPEAFIYEKHSIDSLQFAQSHKYYISDLEQYEKMLDKIIKRVKTEKDEYAEKISENAELGKEISNDSLPKTTQIDCLKIQEGR